MKKILSLVLLFAMVMSAYGTQVTKPTHITVTNGLPAPSNLIIVQQGGSACQFNIGSPGCVTNSQELQWAAVSGATNYTVLRNSVILASGVACCTYTDTTASNSNILSSFGTETVWTYEVEACNGGCGSAVTPALYMFDGSQNQNSCANFSGGGFGTGATSGATVNTTNGSSIITVTALAGNPMNPYQGIGSNSAFPQVYVNIPQSPSGAYVLPFGSGGTSGTGGTGTYQVSENAQATLTGQQMGAIPESCFVTQIVQSGHTYSLGSTFQGGGYIQQVTGTPGVPPYDANVGAMSYAVIDVYPLDCTHTAAMFQMSRPGGAGSGTGDIYSNYTATLYTNCASSYGTVVANSWNTLKIPMGTLGEGIGTATASVTSHWHGTGEDPTGSTTLTIQTTADGNASNIAVGDYLIAFIGSGTQGLQVTSVSGLPTSVTVEACPGDRVGSINDIASGTAIYDAFITVSSTAGAPVDNGGMLTGTGVPNGTFAQCTSAGGNASIGQWGIANGNASAIANESSEVLSFQRISLYKPNIQVTGSGVATVFWDKFGWSN